MGFIIAAIMTLTAILLTIPTSTKEGKTSLAREYALHRLVEHYRAHARFPETFNISFYPYLSYSQEPSHAVVRLAGKDRRVNTGDDVVVVLTTDELNGNHKLLERRAETLEQAFYSLCQRRKSVTGSVYYPSTIDDLVREAGLPQEWKYTPSGTKFLYDTSSCSSVICYCTQRVIRKN